MSVTSLLTEQENKVLALAWQCFEAPPKLDFAKLGPLAGYTNPRSCSNAFARIKKKLADLADASLPAGNSTENDDDAKASANTPKGKAKSAKPKEDPSSKSRPTPKRKAPKRKAGDQATDDESLTEENGNAIDHADSATDSEGEAPNGKKKVTAVTKSKTPAAAKSKATTNGKSNKAKKAKVEDTEDNVPAPDTKRMFPNLKDPGQTKSKDTTTPTDTATGRTQRSTSRAATPIANGGKAPRVKKGNKAPATIKEDEDEKEVVSEHGAVDGDTEEDQGI